MPRSHALPRPLAQLAAALDLPVKSVHIWFQNRRQRLQIKTGAPPTTAAAALPPPPGSPPPAPESGNAVLNNGQRWETWPCEWDEAPSLGADFPCTYPRCEEGGMKQGNVRTVVSEAAVLVLWVWILMLATGVIERIESHQVLDGAEVLVKLPPSDLAEDAKKEEDGFVQLESPEA